MQLPTIHMNGTSAETLLEGYLTALSAIDAAMTALRETAPNGRDYYPQGFDAINLAMAEHAVRLTHLKAVRDELEKLAEAVSDRLAA